MIEECLRREEVRKYAKKVQDRQNWIPVTGKNEKSTIAKANKKHHTNRGCEHAMKVSEKWM